MKKIAILCSGGDVSSMNAVLKRFVDYSIAKGLIPYFVNNGYDGLIDNNIYKAGYSDVAGIISSGGTKIRSSRSKRFKDIGYRKQAISNLKDHCIDYVVVLGGDGSFRGMQEISNESESIVFGGIPSTIDNDIAGTNYCLGVDTALNGIKYAIDSIRDTASSLGRAFVVEIMGRESGYLTLVSALTSGAEMCLIPEIPHNLDAYKKRFKKEIKQGREYFIAIVSEALNNTQEVANWLEKEVNIESRVIILGHVQRGGNPTVYDRLMAFHFATHTIDTILKEHKSFVTCYNSRGFEHKKIEDVAFKKSTIKDELLKLAMEYGDSK